MYFELRMVVNNAERKENCHSCRRRGNSIPLIADIILILSEKVDIKMYFVFCNNHFETNTVLYRNGHETNTKVKTIFLVNYEIVFLVELCR